MEPIDDVVEHVNSLTIVHLSQAIDQYLTSAKAVEDSKYGWVISKHSAISSIIHSYCALESVINETWQAIFFDEKNKLYFPIEKRGYTLRKVVSNWKNTTCMDKLIIISETISKKELPEKLKSNLSELNNLRNWIVHGFVFKTTLLLDSQDPDTKTYTVIEREDDVDWRKKFPNTKFNALDQLDEFDARKALTISLEAIFYVAQAKNGLMALISYFYGPHYSIVSNLSEGAEIILENYLKGARERRKIQ